MSTEEIRAFQKQVGTAAWRLNFDDFSTRLGQDPRHAHTQEMWKAWVVLNKAFNRFDAETLSRIIEGYGDNG